MVRRLTVSVPDEQKEYIDDRGLSPSKILQNEIERRMESE